MKWFLIAVLSLFTFAVVIGVRFQHRDERQIQKVFRSVESAIGKSGEETLLVSHRKAATLANLIAPDCRIVAPEAKIDRILKDSDSSLREIILARQMLTSARLSFDDLDISVSNGSTALVSGDVSLLGHSSAWDFQTLEAREIIARLQKGADGKWRFSSVAIRPILVK